VADCGPGIPEDEMERLFDRFGRPGPSAAGLGVGLWTVRELLEAMAGAIRVERNDQGGSTFRITVPAVPAATPPDPATT
jgi:signal transduction histidine kinase